MADTYTSRIRLRLQETGTNTNVWGDYLNAGGFELIDFAINGHVTVTATATLTTANGTTDQARAATINYTGAASGAITIPGVEKSYDVRAATSDVTISNGSSSLTVKAGDTSRVVTDGTSIWRVQTNDRGGQRLKNVGSPVLGTDAATKAYADSLAMAETNLPGVEGNRGRFLVVNAAGDGGIWQLDEITKTANYTAVVGDRIVADTSGGAFTITLPASPEEGDQLWIRDGGNATDNQGWRLNPLILDPGAETIRGDSDATTSLDLKGVRVSVQFHDNEWNLTIG